MPSHIIKYIWKYSKQRQLLLILLTFASFPLLYFSLEIPKIIINEVLSNQSASQEFLGWQLEPFKFLLILSFSLLGLVVINGLFKIYINTLKGKVGEGLVQRLRHLLMRQLLQFPLQHFEHMPAGEVSITVVQETDPLAGFMSESFALPVFQGGTLLTILLFMFMQDWILGVASLSLVPVQIFIIPRLQRQINLLRKERIQKVRTLSSRVVETVEAVDEIHIQGTQRYTLAEFSYRFRALYKVRLAIFKKKFFMKFLNNLLGHMTPFLFYAIGGYLILEGRLTIGALVAAIAAHKDFLNPWKELLNYYQSYQDNIIKYQNIIEKFFPHEQADLKTQSGAAAPQKEVDIDINEVFKSPLCLKNASFYKESGETLIQNINLSIAQGEKIAIVAEDNEEARALARVLSGLQTLSQGEATLGEVSLEQLPGNQLRRNIGLVTAHPHLFNAALSYNLAYALNQIPPVVPPERKSELDGAIKAGTSPDWFDETFDCVWTDLARLEAEGWGDVLGWVYEQMQVVNASEQMVNLALQEIFNPEDYGEVVFGDFPEKILTLRPILQQRLQAKLPSHHFEIFKPEQFLYHSSLEENLIFGVCLANDKNTRRLLTKEITLKLIEHDILEESHVATTLVLKNLLDGYHNSSLDQSVLKKFNLSNEDEAFNLQQLNKIPKSAFNKKERRNIANFEKIIDIFLKIVPSEWKSVEFPKSYEDSIIAIRQELKESLSEMDMDSYYPFDDGRYNPGLNVTHNLLFGRLDENAPEDAHLLQTQVDRLIQEEELEANLIQLMIINNQAGVGGNRIPESTRHKLNLARTLMKKPAILIMHDALLPLSHVQQATILNNIRRSRPDMTLVWISTESRHDESFEKIYQLNKTLSTVSSGASVQNYPQRQISLLVAYNPGGATDYQARIVTMLATAINDDSQNKYLGQPLLVVNHSGNGGQAGWNHFVTSAEKTGYELAVYNLPHMVAQAIRFPEKIKYTLDNIEPLVNWGADPAVFIVSHESPFRSMRDVVNFAKKRPGKCTVSGAGRYTGHHIAKLQLDKETGIKFRYISGDGGDNALKMVVRHQVVAGFNNLSDAYRNRDKVRVLGVADLERNKEFFPDVPTLVEQGIAVNDASINLRGIMAPKGLPEEQLDYLVERLHAMFSDELVAEKMSEAGAPLRIMKRPEIRKMWLKHQSLVADLVSR